MFTDTKTTIGIACVLVSALPLKGIAGDAALNFRVPHSAYAFEPSPDCAGWRQRAHELFRDEEFVSGVSSLNITAGAVVATIGFYDGISAKHGGEISKLIRKIHGGSYASCLTVSYMVPEGVTAGSIELSDRHGNSRTKLPLQVGYWPRIDASDDWSNWRDIEVTQARGRMFVTATAANWQHNSGTNQTLRIKWTSSGASNDVHQSYELIGSPPPPPPPQPSKEKGEGGLHHTK